MVLWGDIVVKLAKDIFYSLHALLTYNALFSFVIGNRGAGKTYSAKEWAIRSFLKNGKQFIYLRRYKSELKTMSGFFNDIADGFPGVKFEVKGSKLYINDKLAGLLVPLSNSLVMKGTSLPSVDKIIFDEFVIDKGHLRYLDNEVVKFLEFYETVARMRDDVRAVFLSNAVSVVNPYFLYWNVRPKPNKRFTRVGQLLIEFVQNEEFKEEKYKTRFGQLIKGTEYGDYAIENKFLVDNDNFVDLRANTAKPCALVHFKGHTYGFWVDHVKGRFHVSDKYDPSCLIQYTLTDEDHQPNMMLVRTKSKGLYLQAFIEAYEKGYCWFDNLTVKNQALEMFKMLKG